MWDSLREMTQGETTVFSKEISCEYNDSRQKVEPHGFIRTMTNATHQLFIDIDWE